MQNWGAQQMKNLESFASLLVVKTWFAFRNQKKKGNCVTAKKR